MSSRIIGIETEFGCLVDSEAGTPEDIVEAVKTHAFGTKQLGLIDLHARDYTFEPARAGGFLLNGGRLYIDAVGSHEEYATPECTALHDVLIYDRAGRALVQLLLDDLGLADRASFHNNSVDHFGGHTFGCHENFLVRADALSFKESLGGLLPFLVTRQIFAGTGRVGGHRLTRDFRRNVMQLSDFEADYVYVSQFYGVELDEAVDFQLSQRADHIVTSQSSRVRFNRALINPKWDTYYDFSDRHRLHLLFGESNLCEYAAALKIGTTSLVLELLESDRLPGGIELEHPIVALRKVSRDRSAFDGTTATRWLVERADGGTIGAVDVQRSYLAAARRDCAGRDEETDWILIEWEATLDALERDPLTLSDRLDWVAKYTLLNEFRESESLAWNDDALHSLDLEYHNLNPDRGLYFGLEQAGAVRRLTTDAEVFRALTHPPANTRAFGRGQLIHELLQRNATRYVIDWDMLALSEHRQLRFKDPFHTYEREAEAFLRHAE